MLQDTSVLSPVIPVAFIAGMMIYYAMFSPSKILETHSMLLMGAMAGPIVKMVLLMMVQCSRYLTSSLFTFLLVTD